MRRATHYRPNVDDGCRTGASLFARSRQRRFDGLFSADALDDAVRVERVTGMVRPRRRQPIKARHAQSHTTHAIFNVIENSPTRTSRGIVSLR